MTLVALLPALCAAQVAANDAATPATPKLDELRATVVSAIDSGRDFLVAHQNQDGSFGTFHTTRVDEVTAAVPGSLEAFSVATSALCVMALDQCARPSQEASAAASKGVDFLLAHRRVKRPTGMEFYNTWTLGFGLQALCEWLARHPDDARKETITAACRELLERLPSYQVLDGGFAYYDFGAQTLPPSWSSTSFTTATVLVGVARAQKLGLAAPKDVAQRAVARVAADQTPEGSFLYGRYLWSRPRMGINEPKGSACRTPADLYALDLHGKAPKRGAYVEALDNLCVKYLGFQQIAVHRPIPHEAWYNISGYFYLYGFYYAALVLDEKLPSEQQTRLYPSLARAVLHCREKDGSFWDYPLYDYHQSYGTAFALLALSRAPKGFFAAE